MTNVQPCLVGVRQSVNPDGLAALRLAVAISRDPLAGRAREQIAFRSIPRPRAASRTATRVGAAHREQVATEEIAPGGQDSPPKIPSPTPSPEPTSQQAVIMSAVRRAQEGDGEAFGELYDAYVDLVHRYISHRVGNHALAEDLTSETFLRALRRIGTFTWQGRDFGAWLVTIARNLIADHFKSSRYKLEQTTPDILDAAGDSSFEGPENEVLSGITNATLLAAVRQLGAEQQECIVLRFLQGMSVAETAAILGKNEGAVKALQYRAVKALGRLLPAELLS